MRLLFDQNLSPRLIHILEHAFPRSDHVGNLGLDEATDLQVWEYARERQFILVSKDDDFRPYAFLHALHRR